MDFTEVLETKGAPAIAVEFNGSAPLIDVASISTFINVQNKLVSNSSNIISLRHSLAYAIKCADPAGKGEPSAESLASGAKRYGHVITIYTVLLILAKSGVSVAVRTSDVIAASDLKGVEGDDEKAIFGKYVKIADALYAVANKNEEHMAKLASDSRFVLLCLLANAIHRKQVNGHNWITEDTSRNNTSAKKATSIAAAESGAFAEFMARYGHDLWHFLNDSSLYSVADHLTGHRPAKIVKSVLYGGNECEGKFVHEALVMGQAACDRWPIGNIGISGMMLGLTAVSSMVSDIGSKIQISNQAAIIRAIRAVKEFLVVPNMSRDAITSAKDSLAPVIAVALGYVAASRHLNDSMKEGKSLDVFGANHGEKKALGSTLAKRVAEIKADDNAFATSITAVMGEIAAALGGVDTTTDIPAIDPISTRDAEEFVISVKESEAKRKIGVADAMVKVKEFTSADFEAYEAL